MQCIYDVPILKKDSEIGTLSEFRHRWLLIVNVASRCGFTKQYADLERMHKRYQAQGLSIVAFPCNQFLNQEPGHLNDIQAFAKQCFSVSFPIYEKIKVKGSKQAPIYQYLQNHIQKKPFIFVPWNFTKILISPHGAVIRQFLPWQSASKIVAEIYQK